MIKRHILIGDLGCIVDLDDGQSVYVFDTKQRIVLNGVAREATREEVEDLYPDDHDWNTADRNPTKADLDRYKSVMAEA
jgi:hypothetical protein